MAQTSKLSRRAKNELNDLVHSYSGRNLNDPDVLSDIYFDSDPIQSKFNTIDKKTRLNKDKRKFKRKTNNTFEL